MSLLINFVAFQIGWFATVMSGANNLAWAGTLVASAIIVLHLWRVSNPSKELLLIALVGAIGAVWDSALVALGFTVYPFGTLIEGTAPHWIVAMWMLFATTLNISMRWLRRRWLLAGVFGAIFGPLAFYGGYKLGGVTFPDVTNAMIVLSIGWAVFMPMLLALATKLDGTKTTPTAPHFKQRQPV